MNTKKILQFSIGPVGGAVLGLATLPIITWLFSQEDIGRLSMMQITISFSLLLFSLGLDQAYVREFHEAEDKPSLLRAVILPGISLLTLIIIILAIIPWSISKLLFGIDSTFLTLLLGIAVYLSFFSRFLGLILRMQEKGLAYSTSQVLPKLLFLLIVLGYIWIGVDAVFENLMLANTLSLLAVFIIFSWNTRKYWILALTANVDKFKQYQMLRYSVPLIGSGLAFWGLTTTDKLFLRGLSSFSELGIYSISFSFAGVALIFQAIFSTVWAPMVYKWVKEGIDIDKIKTVINYAALVVVLIWSLSGSFSWLVTYILPENYNDVQYILVAAMAYPLLYTLSEATGVGINVKRQTLYSLLAAILALIINAVGNWLLIPNYGAAGAAIASAIAFLIFFVIRTEISSRIWISFPRIKMYLIVSLLALTSIGINIQSIQFYARSIFVIVFIIALILSVNIAAKTYLKRRY